MKNRIRFRKLGRTTSHRQAMFRNMVTSLIEHERVRTTVPKAKEMRRIADRVVQWAKEGDRDRRAQALGFVRSAAMVNKLWTELAPRYKDRVGGFCRVIRCGFRTGDRAPMAVLEYVDRPGEVRPARPARPNPTAQVKRTKAIPTVHGGVPPLPSGPGAAHAALAAAAQAAQRVAALQKSIKLA